MEDLFPIIVFLVFFVLAPLLEAKKKRQQRQGQQRPPQPLQRTPVRSRVEEVSSRSRESQSAATMVPDDLWEILTGQKRTPVRTAPPPVECRPARPSWDVVYDPEADDEEESLEAGWEKASREDVDIERRRASREDVDIERRRAAREPVSLERMERHPAPVIVSLEDNIPTVAQRHAAFHQKVKQTAASAPAPRAERSRVSRLALRNRSEMQRAFLMMEVLGPPKGLE